MRLTLWQVSGLAGLVVCQQCQFRMTATRVTARDKNREYLYLRSVHCPQRPKCRAIPYQELLQQTIERICQDLTPRGCKDECFEWGGGERFASNRNC